MAAPDLSGEGCPVPLETLRQDQKAELLELLASLRGKKCLVIDKAIGTVLHHILADGGYRVLKDHNVTLLRTVSDQELDFAAPDGSQDVPDHVVYLVRPSIPQVKLVAAQIRDSLPARHGPHCHVYFVPHTAVVCEQVLEDEKMPPSGAPGEPPTSVLERVQLGEYHLGLITLDEDLVSLEMGDVFRQCYVDGDNSSLTSVARALHKFQLLYGVVPNVKCKGALSRKVAEKLLRMRQEEEPGVFPQRPEVDTILLLDRDVDLWTPMTTPLTYEGLVDEFFGIDSGRVKLDASILGGGDDESKGGEATGAAAPSSAGPSGAGGAGGAKVPVSLNASDALFAEIRDLSIEALGAYLQEKAIRIKQSYSQFRDKRDASITEIHDFVKRIPGLTQEYKSLTQHINIAEQLKRATDAREFRERWHTERSILEGDSALDALEDLVAADVRRERGLLALRLLSLQSLAGGGVRANRYDAIRRMMIHNYGYDMLFTMGNLERAGLLRRREMTIVDTGSSWTSLRRQLRLINDNVDPMAPTDLAYVSSGYAPVSARLVQATAAPGGWGAVADAMRLLPGPSVEFSQGPDAVDLAEAVRRGASSNAPPVPGATDDGAGGGGGGGGGGKRRVMLVFFVGGLTFMELAALRFLSRSATFPYTVLAGATQVTNGSKLIASLASEVERGGRA